MELDKTEIIAIVSSLVMTIGALAAMIKVYYKRDQQDLKSCREMYDEANKEIKELNGKYNYLQGRLDGVEQLSKSMLEKMERRREDVNSAKDSRTS